MAQGPSPPPTLPSELATACTELSVSQLRALAEYADAVADHRERAERRNRREETPDERPDDRPDDVPAGASVTVKEINENRYRYWQWRDGEKIKSKYIGPANPEE